MAQAIISPLLKSGKLKSDQIIGVVGRRESIASISERFPSELCICTPDSSEAIKAWNAPVKILSIKPQQLDLVSKEANQCIKPESSNSLLISLIAGVKLQRLKAIFSESFCVRVVPNAPVFVGSGLTGISWGDSFPIDKVSLVKDIFEPISELIDLPEAQLDAFLALTSSGPAYVALIVEGLADGAVAAGLPRELALELAHKTLSGTASLLNKKKLHPAQLKDMVASPAGTTISALRHLEKSGLRSALIEAVVLAAERSKELS